nr:hypothetical protein [Micromonospora sp. DSM 115978]
MPAARRGAARAPITTVRPSRCGRASPGYPRQRPRVPPHHRGLPSPRTPPSHPNPSGPSSQHRRPSPPVLHRSSQRRRNDRPDLPDHRHRSQHRQHSLHSQCRRPGRCRP